MDRRTFVVSISVGLVAAPASTLCKGHTTGAMACPLGGTTGEPETTTDEARP